MKIKGMLRRIVCVFLFSLCASTFAVDEPSHVNEVKNETKNQAKVAPSQMRVGTYLTSLYDFNPNNNTFTADLWLWFLHDKSQDLNPLKSLEITNARDFKTGLSSSQDQGAERYDTVKIHGIFNYDWDVKNFPFDRHELKIRVEDGVADASKVIYNPDSANTAFDPAIKIDGWHIDKIAIATGNHNYNSSFGIGGATGSTYSNSIVSIFIQRDAAGLFWKLLSAVYIAFLVSLVTFFMDTSKDGLFNGRISVLIGMMFAVVINSQRVSSTIGQSVAFTLADKIHVVTLISILCSLIAALVSRHLMITNRAEYSVRLDRRLAGITFAIFVAINAFMILTAANAGA